MGNNGYFSGTALNDFDLWRWIVGFGGNVKVIEPPELVNKVKEIGTGIIQVYDSTYQSSCGH